jgi:hypothetical protein
VNRSSSSVGLENAVDGLRDADAVARSQIFDAADVKHAASFASSGWLRHESGARTSL